MSLTTEIASNQHLTRKAHNVKNRNDKSLKVDQKFEKDQNLESLFFLIDQNVKNEEVDQNIEKNVKSQK
jgi:hypothetical protein